MVDLSISISGRLAVALERLAIEEGVHTHEAVILALQNWLAEHSYIQTDPVLSEDTETMGDA